MRRGARPASLAEAGKVRDSGPMRRRLILLHPLLFAAYPVLFLFAANAADQVTLEPLWLPLGVSVAAAALLTAMLSVLLRDPVRGGLLATLAIGLFFAYGHVWNLVGTFLGDQWPLIGAWALLAVLGGVAVWRSGRWGRPTARTLTVLGAIAVALNIGSLAAYSLDGTIAAGVSGPVGRVGATDETPPKRPDIYYIILDRYAGAQTLAREYGYDNTPFLDELERRGFYVADESDANYIKTPLSLDSSLSMDYLDADALRAEATSGKDREPIHRRLRGLLAVPVSLKELGYRYVQISNWWEPTRDNVDADVVYRYSGQSEFSTALLQTTLLRALTPDATIQDPWDWGVLREHTLYELDRLSRMPELPGPKFVFTHLLIPHDPYVFDRDGSFMDRDQVAAQGQGESYVRQLEFTNSRILEIIDRLLAGSPEDRPIILLQSDEGPFPDRYQADEWGFEWTDATDAELQEKFRILNTFYLPGVDPVEAGLYESISPVNSFRVVFNAYFGTDLPLLPDRIYAHTDLDHFYDFFEITDRLN